MKHPTTGIVIPVFNQLYFTKQCLASLIPTIEKKVRVVVINNGSSDETQAYLETVEGIEVIHNEQNLGCAPAWNQGVKHLATEWTVILNNDTLLTEGWLQGLLRAAEQERLGIVSPAMREGEFNYDLVEYAKDYLEKMATFHRLQFAHGVCFMVRRSTFEQIGYFDEGFKIATYEDTDFWRRANQAGIRIAITGAAFIHHFGFGTQSLHRRQGKPPHEIDNQAYFRKKWKIGWLKRKLERRKRLKQTQAYIKNELAATGHSLNEQWLENMLKYR